MSMTIREAYEQNPCLLGSPKMVAIFESLANIPHDQRVINPTIGSISITSDGFLISMNQFLGSAEDLEANLIGLCEHFNSNIAEVEELMSNTTDWRIGGHAYNKP